MAKLQATSSTAPVFRYLPVSKVKACFKFPLIAAGLVAAMASGAARAQGAPVGDITLTIGQAVIVSADGSSQEARRGGKIHPGDRVETADGGHVHIRFVDGALVAVRPTSRLVVEDYQYNAQTVSKSLVRFRLEKGVTRAISGAAAEGAKERFRLNTPLVAIGVRGTDFVVRTGANQTIAAVNQGAIVMAPFGEGCSAQAFGPCGSPTARLLSADMGNMLVEFRNTLAQPELKPFNRVRAPETQLASAEPQSGIEPGVAREPVKPSARGGNEEAVTAALVQDVVRKVSDGSVVTTPVVLPPAQLAWGRWAAGPVDKTDFSVARTLAREGRMVTIGDNDFLLYRVEGASATVSQGLGNVSFALQQAHAHFTDPSSQVQAASVTGGALAVDFAGRSFSTTLNLSSAATGSVSLQAAGAIRDDGLFTARSLTQSVAGATALDGKSAGYLFEKAAAGGTLSGITLWSR